MSKHDLLIGQDANVFAVNCEFDEEEGTLMCGALYLSAGIKRTSMRLTDKSVKLSIEIPSELLRTPATYKAWNVQLPAHL